MIFACLHQCGFASLTNYEVRRQIRCIRYNSCMYAICSAKQFIIRNRRSWKMRNFSVFIPITKNRCRICREQVKQVKLKRGSLLKIKEIKSSSVPGFWGKIHQSHFLNLNSALKCLVFSSVFWLGFNVHLISLYTAIDPSPTYTTSDGTLPTIHFYLQSSVLLIPLCT